MRDWYLNISRELRAGIFNKEEEEYLVNYYREVGLLRGWRNEYFYRHFADAFARSAKFFLDGKSDPLILDLGCGAGTQSLYLALMGAKIAALDMNETALDVFRKRIDFYSNITGRTLDITIHQVNVFSFDYSSIAPIDGLYSMFAFNMMQPSKKLLSLIQPHFNKRARIAILDGNNLCWLSRINPLRRRDVLSPMAFRMQLEHNGFNIMEHLGGIAVPPVLWMAEIGNSISFIDRLLCKTWFFPVSHMILAEKNG